MCGQQGEGRVCAGKVLRVDGLVDGVGVAGEVAALVGGKDAACGGVCWACRQTGAEWVWGEERGPPELNGLCKQPSKCRLAWAVVNQPGLAPVTNPPAMLIQDTNMIMPWAALREKNRCMKVLLPAMCALAAPIAACRSLLAATAPGPPAASCCVTSLRAARSMRSS